MIFARIFGFVARKSQSDTDNECHLFAEHDPEQPASAIVNFVSKVMIGSNRPKWGSLSSQDQGDTPSTRTEHTAIQTKDHTGAQVVLCRRYQALCIIMCIYCCFSRGESIKRTFPSSSTCHSANSLKKWDFLVKRVNRQILCQTIYPRSTDVKCFRKYTCPVFLYMNSLCIFGEKNAIVPGCQRKHKIVF